MNPAAQIVVVGASVAGAALVAQLREDGFEGRILVVDEDPDAPYDRPPLSKDFLGATTDRPDAPWWDDRCDFLRARATGLDVQSSTLTVSSTEEGSRAVRADHIVVATGSTPVRLPGEPAGVINLRTAADARLLREQVRPGHKVLILGAGTIGTELASSLASAGRTVTLVDFADRPLDRFLGGHLGDAAAAWIRDAGVALHLNTRVEQIIRHGKRWSVRTDREEFRADFVVSAVGTRPATDWLAGTDLDLSQGIRCNVDGAALDITGRRVPNVHAIGDVAAWQIDDGWRRYEDWTSAQRRGRHLARHLLGLNPAEPTGQDLAYFWSHQFGRRIQVLGTPARDATLVQQLDEPGRKAAFYTVERDGNPVAWIAINAPKQFALAMRASMQMSG